MRLVAVLILLANGALADGWAPLDAQGISKALSARVLQYPNNAQQDFFADGRTLYQTRDSNWGKWRVDYDQYCSIWPPADGWACYKVSISPNGLSVRFTDKDGGHSDGKYIDLN
tara:strand:- start:561 stop:902 length:342 start_codon:yes stop_codon:yes gene_type:complete